MKIYSLIEIDIASGEVVRAESEDYSGAVALCKGEASKAEQAAADQQRAMQNQLMQQQLGMFQNQLSGVNKVLDPMIAQGGFSPATQAALYNQATSGLTQQFQGANANLNNELVARGMTGGQMAGAGGVARGFGQLNALEAGLQSQAINDIQLQKQQALMNELGMKMGIGSQFGGMTSTFNQGANSALNSGVEAARNVDQSQGGFFGSLFGGLAGLGSSGLKAWSNRNQG